LAFELHQATESKQAFGIRLAPTCFEHAHAVDERSDLRAGAATEVFSRKARIRRSS
jgi:hypothetical protein